MPSFDSARLVDRDDVRMMPVGRSLSLRAKPEPRTDSRRRDRQTRSVFRVGQSADAEANALIRKKYRDGWTLNG